jgi:hypothetical protein
MTRVACPLWTGVAWDICHCHQSRWASELPLIVKIVSHCATGVAKHSAKPRWCIADYVVITSRSAIDISVSFRRLTHYLIGTIRCIDIEAQAIKVCMVPQWCWHFNTSSVTLQLQIWHSMTGELRHLHACNIYCGLACGQVDGNWQIDIAILVLAD